LLANFARKHFETAGELRPIDRQIVKSGSIFYELIERPMKILDKDVAALQPSRSSRRRDRTTERKKWPSEF